MDSNGAYDCFGYEEDDPDDRSQKICYCIIRRNGQVVKVISSTRQKRSYERYWYVPLVFGIIGIGTSLCSIVKGV
nr:MAG TPA: hypothetical protein [Caudoviricetes sp.]